MVVRKRSPEPRPSAGALDTVGRSVVRVDAEEKVTGRTRYVDDYHPEGCLYAATVRSGRPFISIRGIDAARARAITGVRAVLTARDIPGKNFWPLVLSDYPVLADGVARFAGEAVALVVAETRRAALHAARLVRIDFEEKTPVFDPEEAMREGAPKIFGDDNVFRRYAVHKGDVERGFAEADVVVEGEFETGYQVQAYLETQGIIAEPTYECGMRVVGSMQCPFYVHDAVAAVLGAPHNRVQIVQLPTGGGFGGKEDMPSLVGAHAALAAWATGRPVKIVYSREEDFVSMSKRHPARIRVRYGARRDGTLTACEVRYVLDGGAYATLSPVVLFRGTVHAAGPYRIENVRIESFAVATNKVPCGAFRGFGQPQVCFAQEGLLDELAERLGLDPLDLRRKNALRIGDTTATGQPIRESCGFEEVIERAVETSDYRQKRASFGKSDAGAIRRRGIGLALNYYGVGLGAGGRYIDRAGASVQIQKDGTVLIAVGNTEIGQGARTVLAQIGAEALGAPFLAVHVMEIDTTRVPDSGPTVASRTTLVSGNAILDACRKLCADLDPLRSEMGSEAGFARLAEEAYKRKLPMAAQGWWVSPPTSFDEQGRGDAYLVYAFSANVAEVEVDRETGECKVVEIVSAHDVGRAINPQQAEGQIEGGVAQAVGYAVLEHLVSEQGLLKNVNFTGYILPTASDAPRIVPILVERAFPGGPYGAKGLAESPIVGPAAAIANAIAQAAGVRVRRLPALPEVVREAIRRSEQIS